MTLLVSRHASFVLMVAPAPQSIVSWLQVHYQAVLPLQRHLAELQQEHAALKRTAAEARAAAEMAATKQATGDQQLELGEVEATALVLESHERSQQVSLVLHCSAACCTPLEAASHGDALGFTNRSAWPTQAAETPKGNQLVRKALSVLSMLGQPLPLSTGLGSQQAP